MIELIRCFVELISLVILAVYMSYYSRTKDEFDHFILITINYIIILINLVL